MDEALGLAEDSLEGLHIPARPGAPWGPSGGAVKCCQREGGLEHLTKLLPP